MKPLYIGLLSGTSIDCIDAAVIDASAEKPVLLAHHQHPIDPVTKQAIAALCLPGDNEIDRMGQMDIKLGGLFADAANALLKKAKLAHNDIVAIGSHGQTIRHRPPKSSDSLGFTLQIGDANTIAENTHITTVADFRRRDMATGGQGAPFAPAFHQSIAPQGSETCAFLNLGGIANITLLQHRKIVSGFDAGPANGLMDAWILKNKNCAFDNNGEWARTGKVNSNLLKQLKKHPYFDLPAPKSTGREEFHLHWLESILANGDQLAAEDVQATLLRLSSETIADAITQQAHQPSVIYCCGGGAHNAALLDDLQSILNKTTITTTEALGIAPDWVEACAFAWLAQQRMEGKKVSLSDVTGAKRNRIAGCIYAA